MSLSGLDSRVVLVLGHRRLVVQSLGLFKLVRHGMNPTWVDTHHHTARRYQGKWWIENAPDYLLPHVNIFHFLLALHLLCNGLCPS